ncbi:uncharacterized protein LOC129457093 [Periophthalmus magnuspinnatus]|uniref:uncharacterized protein LOC129457093 n=1 Tax=Periophthalmus magnuspinnatus TaxID=409849 RepID=UPI002436C3D6|nr:uncharacterized protein LOC129457093 [Periophthalmus magnuspinnatus]
MYHCGVMNEYDVSFGPGTEVVVDGKSKPPPSLLPSVPPSLLPSVPPSLLQSVVQSPDYIKVQPGDSVTLSCSFNTSHCAKDHISVIWKKRNSTSKIISWGNGTKNIVCENQMSTGGTSCVTDLTMIWMDLSSAGDETYLCEVTACGHTLQGRGTKVHLYNGEPCTKGSFDVFSLSPTAIALMGLNIAFGVSVLVLVLVLVVCSNHRKQDPDIGRGANQDIKGEDEIMYARVNVGPIRATEETPDEEASLYSQVKIRPKDTTSHK